MALSGVERRSNDNLPPEQPRHVRLLSPLPATHDLRARRRRAGGGPSPSRADQAGEQIAAATTAVDDQAALPPPRGREPTDRVLRACAPRHDSTRGSSTRMQPVVGGSVWRCGGRGDGSVARRQRFSRDAAYRRAGSTFRALRDMCPELRNKCLQLRNKSRPAEGDDLAVLQGFRDILRRWNQKTQLRTKAPTSRNPLDLIKHPLLQVPSPDLLRSSGPF